MVRSGRESDPRCWKRPRGRDGLTQLAGGLDATATGGVRADTAGINVPPRGPSSVFPFWNWVMSRDSRTVISASPTASRF